MVALEQIYPHVLLLQPGKDSVTISDKGIRNGMVLLTQTLALSCCFIKACNILLCWKVVRVR
jgi:hypothetical protein